MPYKIKRFSAAVHGFVRSDAQSFVRWRQPKSRGHQHDAGNEQHRLRETINALSQLRAGTGGANSRVIL
ncbi:hypothetical protein [Glutamicibacter sp.]|uniref:hypothetical protein n=1 Tax=Glutamicibacter sp. TaxID=1931995 RepID=UPI002B468DFF|nr:hypothetical protein [Glutamicibacter sp.]HJX79797.1 hypothetical protein [Glutamicibacter sp.]